MAASAAASGRDLGWVDGGVAAAQAPLSRDDQEHHDETESDGSDWDPDQSDPEEDDADSGDDDEESDNEVDGDGVAGPEIEQAVLKRLRDQHADEAVRILVATTDYVAETGGDLTFAAGDEFEFLGQALDPSLVQVRTLSRPVAQGNVPIAFVRDVQSGPSDEGVSPETIHTVETLIETKQLPAGCFILKHCESQPQARHSLNTPSVAAGFGIHFLRRWHGHQNTLLELRWGRDWLHMASRSLIYSTGLMRVARGAPWHPIRQTYRSSLSCSLRSTFLNRRPSLALLWWQGRHAWLRCTVRAAVSPATFFSSVERRPGRVGPLPRGATSLAG
mmetsp:Transcript_16785/g.49383  ORF Transcript_16785/g.49383 Transcript_16785/m.49383 type:complete len:332 (-) Transcript_16785:1977-2972(-)